VSRFGNVSICFLDGRSLLLTFGVVSPFDNFLLIFCFSFFVPFHLFSARLTKAYQTAAVLFEVLKAVNLTQSLEVDNEVIVTCF